MATPRNDSTAPLTRFCFAVEEHRRTPEGRVKTAQQFVAHFFTQSETAPQDRIFKHLPKDVRGPVISTWGIRGAKAALRDSDEKVAAVVMVPALFMGLHFFVGIIQAYVFTLLAIIYVGGAVAHEH